MRPQHSRIHHLLSAAIDCRPLHGSYPRAIVAIPSSQSPCRPMSYGRSVINCLLDPSRVSWIALPKIFEWPLHHAELGLAVHPNAV
jgi:hypothetical protein